MNKNRVIENEYIEQSVLRIPFLKQFAIYEGNNIVSFSSVRINEYMEYKLIPFRSGLDSKSINELLKKAEERGDL